MPEFTTDQQKAIDARNKDILVAAAAGSGKTAVLVERIIKMVSDSENPIDIDRLLVVTFTDAAASEMKQRISKALTDKLTGDPYNEHLQKQITLLNKSFITTIHSFCLRIIRQNFHLLDIDPTFRIADETELVLIKQDIIDEIFEKWYEKEYDENFFTLVECFGSKVSDKRLQDLILKIHSFIENSPNPFEFTVSCIKNLDVSNINSLDETIWAKILVKEIQSELHGVLHDISVAEKYCKMPDGPLVYLETLNDDRQIVYDLINASKISLEELYNVCSNITFKKIATIKKSSSINLELKEKAQSIRDDSIKPIIKRIQKEYFFKHPNKMKEDIQNFYPVMRVLGKLVLEFSEIYKQVKKEKNIADFNDLEHFALKILLDPKSTKDKHVVSQKAIEISEYFKEILIDEYQDSNLTQELILWAISKNNPNNRFMVGDIKQSIYKFRRARPELFINKYNSFSRADGFDNLIIDLKKNFRSRDIIISSINFFFIQLMTKEVGEIIYDDNQALYKGANFIDTNLNVSDNTELYIIEHDLPETDNEQDKELYKEIEELSKLELEAKIVGKRILELVYGEQKLYVQDKKQEIRPVEFRDIVILTRSLQNTGEIFIETLKKMNISVVANTSEGFYNSLEVLTVLGFLKIIDNPIQDLELITVLHCPVYSVTSDELLMIKTTDKSKSFYENIFLYLGLEQNDVKLKNKLLKFIDDLNRFRKYAVYMPVNELVSRIYDETDYFNYCGAFSGGLVRQANLRALKEKAIEYENTSFKSLFHFIKYIEKIRTNDKDMGSATLLSENENVVKMMTIHKSKGLEFPVVFVSGLGKGFNFMDERSSFLLHPEYGFATKYFDKDLRIKTNTLPRIAIAKQIHRESLSEELRVLYVALTRAKEKLILTGCVSSTKNALSKWSMFIDYEHAELPSHYMIKATNYLDFLLPAVLRHSDSERLNFDEVSYANKHLYGFQTKFKIEFCCHDDALQSEIVANTKSEEVYNELRKLDLNKDYSGQKQEIYNKLSFSYSYALEKKLPINISIAEIQKMFDLSDLNYEDKTINFEKPSFFDGVKKITNAQRGTIVHTVLENIDLKIHKNSDDVLKLINNLVNRNIITVDEANVIPKERILNFIRSDLANRMRNATFLKKEQPFSLALKPYEIFRDKIYKNIDELILIRGIIDCFFIEDDELYLVDYKTDYVNEDNAQELTMKYSNQVKIYKMALEKMYNKQVKESYIYFIGIDRYVKV